MRRRHEAGFGFVELVITVGVIVILTTLALPSFLRYLRTAEAQADAPPGQGPGLGRWFAIAGGLAVGLVVLVVVVAAALGLF